MKSFGQTQPAQRIDWKNIIQTLHSTRKALIIHLPYMIDGPQFMSSRKIHRLGRLTSNFKPINPLTGYMCSLKQKKIAYQKVEHPVILLTLYQPLITSLPPMFVTLTVTSFVLFSCRHKIHKSSSKRFT